MNESLDGNTSNDLPPPAAVSTWLVLVIFFKNIVKNGVRSFLHMAWSAATWITSCAWTVAPLMLVVVETCGLIALMIAVQQAYGGSGIAVIAVLVLATLLGGELLLNGAMFLMYLKGEESHPDILFLEGKCGYPVVTIALMKMSIAFYGFFFKEFYLPSLRYLQWSYAEAEKEARQLWK